ncbi:MAG TPA: molybdopterin cofactor-binding domain-containing protein [Terriglobia bacterium]|nr:molybdopterin cofactor-binding domain-containing protein [Terriglobia bacterium]
MSRKKISSVIAPTIRPAPAGLKPGATTPKIEPERYELFSSPAYHFDLNRREFFKILGGGLLIVCVLPRAEAGQESGRRGFGRGEQMPKEISAWLHIGENGKVTVYTGKVEMGQNIRTSLTQAVAEELRVAPESIQMVMGDTDLTPFDMGTFGSRTTPTMNPELRKAAAAALDALLDMAAKTWGVDRSKLSAAGGKITDPVSGRSTQYAQLLKGKELAQTIPAEDPLVPADQWNVMGKPLPKVDGRDFVTGKHKYTSDLKLPGMLYGKVLRPSSFGATLTSIDTKDAEAIEGVTVVHDGDFVGVAAPTSALAARALVAIHAEWKSSPQQISSNILFEYLASATSIDSGGGGRRLGSIEQGMASAMAHSEQTYNVAYIAHTPLEPRAAVAEWKDDKLNVWTGTQRPFGVKGELAAAFHIPEDQVRVRVPDTGAAYGGKHTGECAIEAARLARAANRPVKLVWTREEEFTWAYFRPAGVIEVKAGVRKDGTITAWEFHNYNSGSSGIDTPYDVANQLILFHPVKDLLRQGSYRGLAATANHFARESHMDELAQISKMDPLAFRLKNLKNDRLKAVFQAAAEKFGWGKTPATPDRGFGIAGGVEKGGYVATCAEVKIDSKSGEVKIVRVVAAFECGAVVNPDGLRNQVEGANIMGIGGALFEAIEFADGRILNPRLAKYRVPRFSDVPAIEVVLVDRKDLPSAGAGETPLIGLAPAVGNAIFNATGVRLRSLPMAPNGIKL